MTFVLTTQLPEHLLYMQECHPSLLRPTSVETMQLGTVTLVVPKVELLLKQWQGAPIADDFGHKPLIDFAGQPVFAELAVCNLFQLSGWDARWIETYGAPARNPSYYTNWLPTTPPAGRATQLRQPIENQRIAALLQRLMVANGQTFAGCWDVLGWKGEALVFAECKRRRNDKLRPNQPRWLAAGLQEGLRAENFLLVEWDFAPAF